MAVASVLVVSCANMRPYHDGLTLFAKGRVEEKEVIEPREDVFLIPGVSRQIVRADNSESGIYFRLGKDNQFHSYVVSGSSNEVNELAYNLGRARKVYFEFFNNGISIPLATNHFIYSHSIPRENCAFVFEVDEKKLAR